MEKFHLQLFFPSPLPAPQPLRFPEKPSLFFTAQEKDFNPCVLPCEGLKAASFLCGEVWQLGSAREGPWRRRGPRDKSARFEPVPGCSEHTRVASVRINEAPSAASGRHCALCPALGRSPGSWP